MSDTEHASTTLGRTQVSSRLAEEQVAPYISYATEIHNGRLWPDTQLTEPKRQVIFETGFRNRLLDEMRGDSFESRAILFRSLGEPFKQSPRDTAYGMEVWPSDLALSAAADLRHAFIHTDQGWRRWARGWHPVEEAQVARAVRHVAALEARTEATVAATLPLLRQRLHVEPRLFNRGLPFSASEVNTPVNSIEVAEVVAGLRGSKDELTIRLIACRRWELLEKSTDDDLDMLIGALLVRLWEIEGKPPTLA